MDGAWIWAQGLGRPEQTLQSTGTKRPVGLAERFGLQAGKSVGMAEEYQKDLSGAGMIMSKCKYFLQCNGMALELCLGDNVKVHPTEENFTESMSIQG